MVTPVLVAKDRYTLVVASMEANMVSDKKDRKRRTLLVVHKAAVHMVSDSGDDDGRNLLYHRNWMEDLVMAFSCQI